MCLAIPARVVEIVDVESRTAKVEIGGVRRHVNNQEQILASSLAMARAFHRGRKLLVCGNGGSAADAQHVAVRAIVAAEVAESIVRRMRENPLGRGACVIGEVEAEPPGIVAMRTGFGGARVVDMLVGEQLPRIC